MNSITLKAPAKLNLFLNILNKRKDDGYHNIETIFERISLFDTLKLSLNKKSQINLFSTDKTIENEENLCFKATKLIRDKLGLSFGVNINLSKKIPKGAGLGGASSNAAMVLVGLNKLLKLNLSQEKLFYYGAKLGSDVNFFLSNQKFALGFSRGEKIRPIQSNLILEHELLLTNQEISTKFVYDSYKEQANKGRLTKYLDNVKLITYSLERKDRDLLSCLLFNSLTSTYLKISNLASKIYNKLSINPYPFVLSGSGSTVNILLKNKKEQINKKLKNNFAKLGINSLRVNTI